MCSQMPLNPTPYPERMHGSCPHSARDAALFLNALPTFKDIAPAKIALKMRETPKFLDSLCVV